ncbi:DMT family transporter [Stakelama pacifica]|uniref:EamA domain-containing membrane protein RarD n=1 Tax=Stakelama pacifica TaxID=517720 RepID=A0A4R6FRD2_9SPHN|nr:DMT family transporter [Stakelama pacifica]TDN83710.1 EamA domain-containing membrane protein RarD [Stakelama pacifica]GGO94597.1 permease [Stakelama pacifica]
MASVRGNPDHILGGIGLRLFAILCLASMAALIKLVEASGANLIETLFFRQTCAVPLVLAVMAAGPGLGAIRTKRPGAHALRTGIGLMGMFANFGAIMLLPLAEAQTLAFTAPIFATILGALVLREPTGWHRWGAVLAGFAGVLIVARPGSGHIPLVGALVGLAAAFFVALIAILLRQIGRTEGATTTVFWFSTLSVPPLGLAYLWNYQPHDPLTWAMLIAIGLIGGAGQLALTAALRLAPVSVVVPMDYSGLIWATLYGYMLFGMWPTQATWLGAPIIIASGLYIVAREQRLKRLRAA